MFYIRFIRFINTLKNDNYTEKEKFHSVHLLKSHRLNRPVSLFSLILEGLTACHVADGTQ